MSTPNEKKEVNYRTLFIGLGGTGGQVLLKLGNLLDDRQKAKAHMIYIDLDKGDAEKLEAKGMDTVVISSSDTVRDVIARLGTNDGVQDWIPTAANDGEFLASKTDDGASQYRIKSRLCLANFLQNRNNKLAKLLTKVCTVGKEVSDETLRVMIVSSVAGGTGAGTFIQVALYIREFFRKTNHKDVNIMGLFACPDLFVKTLGSKPGDRTNLENMYANAYAAIRELNAMNLAVSVGGLEMIAPGYGKSINIKIQTRSEGKLFDPKDDKFRSNANNKPFNLLYFVDSANEEGGVLTNIQQYYSVMADIVYTRLYSPIEESIRSGESNELGPHSKFPTAIYGSAGYGRIIYPYEDIVRYLAVRRTADEVGCEWFAFEDAWRTYCTQQQAIAKDIGEFWRPTSEERATQFINEMESKLRSGSSSLRSMRGAMKVKDSDTDRAAEYIKLIEKALSSATGLDESKDGKHARCNDQKLKESRTSVCNKYRILADDVQSKAALAVLSDNAESAISEITDYGALLLKGVAGSAFSVANIIIPQNKTSAANAESNKDPLNLLHGLLSANGQPVHPLAARYLLYKLRAYLVKKISSGDPEVAIESAIESMRSACDPNPGDNVTVTVAERIKQLEKAIWFPSMQASAALKDFTDKFQNAIIEVTNAANRAFISNVFSRILEYVEELIVQYEGLFDNLEQYKQDLDQRLRIERVLNNRAANNRTIFVNASAEAKANIYERDQQTRDVLEEGDREIASAAGLGIYNALLERTWKKIGERKNQKALQYKADEEVDTYSDMSGIFEDIIAIYTDYLKEKAPHLQHSVVKALIKQCCLTENIDPNKLDDPMLKRRLRSAFGDVIRDMIAKSYPMLAYDPHNADTYYQSEDGNTETKSYMHIGMHPAMLEDLGAVYAENDNSGAKEAFEEAFAPSKGLTLSTSYDKYTISCFSAVHCLQPTQILKFREDFEDGYYHYYKKRLAMISATGCMSFTPHLDKRWHLREAMPYISRGMELEWHKKTTKAFIYEMLNRMFTYTVSSDNVKCFNYQYDASKAPIFVHWPENRLVTVNDISRLIEYLEEQDERVEQLCVKFDQKIAQIMDILSKNTETMAMYKTALTTCDDLKKLRENLCVAMTFTTGTGKKGAKKSEGKSITKERAKALKEASRIIGCDESVDALTDIKNTLGGLLQIAWLVHKSEERQGRDKDYGEAIIACALEIVEKLCRTMFGENIAENTSEISDYKDLYNSIIEKFMEAFVKYHLVQCNMFTKAKLDAIFDKNTGNGEYTLYNRYLLIPNFLLQTAEFRWVNSQWKLK